MSFSYILVLLPPFCYRINGCIVQVLCIALGAHSLFLCRISPFTKYGPTYRFLPTHTNWLNVCSDSNIPVSLFITSVLRSKSSAFTHKLAALYIHFAFAFDPFLHNSFRWYPVQLNGKAPFWRDVAPIPLSTSASIYRLNISFVYFKHFTIGSNIKSHSRRILRFYM